MTGSLFLQEKKTRVKTYKKRPGSKPTKKDPGQNPDLFIRIRFAKYYSRDYARSTAPERRQDVHT